MVNTQTDRNCLIIFPLDCPVFLFLLQRGSSLRCIKFVVVVSQQYAFSLSVSGDKRARQITFCSGMTYPGSVALIPGSILTFSFRKGSLFSPRSIFDVSFLLYEHYKLL